jgi:uncharacterized protein YkwD
VVLVLALTLSACTASRAPTPPSASETPTVAAAPQPPPADVDALEMRIHARVNAARTERGRPPLDWSAKHHPLARTHSTAMADAGFFDHVDPSGRDVNDRADALDLSCPPGADGSTRRGFGENLYMASRYHERRVQKRSDGTVIRRTYDWKRPKTMAREVVEGWLRSPGHRDNLLSDAYRTESIGVALRDTTYYVTQVFC